MQAAWPPLIPGIHRLFLAGGRVILTLVFGDAVLYGWIRVPLGLTSVALNVLYGLLVLQFNKMLKNAGMAR